MRRFWNIVRYIIVILLDIYFMLTFHSYINFLILVGLILFPVYSLVGVYQVKNGLSLEVKVPEEAMQKGEEFVVSFELNNSTFFPLLNATIPVVTENRFYLEYGEHTLNLPVRARAKTRAEYPVVMDYCGRFIVSADRIYISDLLGFVQLRVPVSIEKECLVFPNGPERAQEAGAMYMRGVSEAVESKEKGFDFSEISGIREYIPGDKLQNIHWKLSSKKEELMVKERVSVSSQQLNVLVELLNDDSMCVEPVLELADSVTRGLTGMNLPFTVFYYSTNLNRVNDIYIGNKVEREKCFEMMLYDRCYKGNGRIEDMFLQDYANGGTYLYIGSGNVSGESGQVMIGEKGSFAELRNA